MNYKDNVAIRTKNLSFKYAENKLEILKNINIEIPKGKITAITGASGSGKSTLAYALCGIIPHGIEGIMAGEVYIDNTNSKELTLAQIGLKVGLVYQNPDYQLFMPTVEEEIIFGLENICKPQDEIKETVDEILMLLNIEHLRYSNPSKLSGGEKRLVAIGAVLALGADAIILDEPYSELDEENKQVLNKVIYDLREKGKSVVVIEHNMEWLRNVDVVYDVGDREHIISL